MIERALRIWRGGVLSAAIAGIALASSPAAEATAADLTLCDAAAVTAAHRTGVPVELLVALARTESGRAMDGALVSWPWTANVAGAGLWFPTRTAAKQAIEAALAQGRTNVDIGCFQINYHWHGAGFASLDEMIEPEQNALYAARFLVSLKQETGSWHRAVGRYHSRRPDHAARYLVRFDAVRRAHGGTRALANSDSSEPLPAPTDQGTKTRDEEIVPFIAGYVRIGSPLQ